MFDSAIVDPVVDFLVEIAGNGRALELGIGTGRIALPLAERGVPVQGIELSKAMAATLRAKPGGEDIGVTIGDFSTASVDGTFSVAYLVFNTIMNLTTQAAQVACFRNVATQLEPGGCFRHRSRRPRAPAAPARRDDSRIPRQREQMGARRVRRREAGPHVASLRDRRRKSRALLGSVPVRVAGGARPDGRTCRDEAARTLERVEAGTVHERQSQARLRLGEAGRLGRLRLRQRLTARS
jgi:SAM-dependent methyltransferase